MASASRSTLGCERLGPTMTTHDTHHGRSQPTPTIQLRSPHAGLVAGISLLASVCACVVDSDPAVSPVVESATSTGELEPADPGGSAELTKDAEKRKAELTVFQLTILDKSARASTSQEQLTDNAELNAVLAVHKVGSYRQAYPFSEIPKLLAVYELRCTGCYPVELMAALEQTGVVSKVRQIAAPIPLDNGNPGGYDPADGLWEHAQDLLWHLVITEADLAWNMTRGDPDVLVAVVDNGFDTNHPELRSKMSALDPSTGLRLTIGGEDHGTATAVMAAGKTAESGATWVSEMPSVGFNTSVAGMMWGSTTAAHYAALAMDADVVSISWYDGCSPDNTGADQLAIREILDHGTTIVAAAGNGLPDCSGRELFPFSAQYDERIIVVTSTTKGDTHANNGGNTHSHYPTVDLAAPGYGVQIAYLGGRTGGWGTSFATPLVAGTVGLMKSVNACLAPADVQHILKNSTDPIVDVAAFPGQVGAGRLNVNRAVALAESTDYACLEGGTFDGANCNMGAPPPGTTAFISGGYYYHTPLPGNSCPLPGSTFDGSNCSVRRVPEHVTPFIWSNYWYYETCAEGGWTPWLNGDAPGGSGDWELRNRFNGVCVHPQAIQCRATNGTYWTQTGDVGVTCDRDIGLSCQNADQPDSTCENYEVRFYCP